MFYLNAPIIQLLMQASAQAGVTILFIYLWVGVYSFNDAPIFLPMAHWHPSNKRGMLVCLESNYSAEQSGMASCSFSCFPSKAFIKVYGTETLHSNHLTPVDK